MLGMLVAGRCGIRARQDTMDRLGLEDLNREASESMLVVDIEMRPLPYE
jgi:hypothetical protein